MITLSVYIVAKALFVPAFAIVSAQSRAKKPKSCRSSVGQPSDKTQWIRSVDRELSGKWKLLQCPHPENAGVALTKGSQYFCLPKFYDLARSLDVLAGAARQ
eukprot:scaffold487263_cov18-Prasinocladus_malaysianus.AAC.1